MTGGRGGSDASSGRPGVPRRATYGRSRGRPLRRGLKTLMETLLPRLRVTLPAFGGALDPAELFGGEFGQVWVEIGFGAGEHLAWQASRHPEVAVLGAEVFVNGIAALLRRIDDLQLTNVRVFQGDGRDLLDALPEDSVSRVFILFPDPWPKQRHHKRRIVQAALLDRLASVMKDGAELRLATDHAEYLRWMLDVATAHPAFRWLASGPADWRERPADWPASRYESKALGEGMVPTYLRFVRRRRGAA